MSMLLTLGMSIAQIIAGLAFFLFIPGYIITLLAFDDLEGLERIMIAAVLSIMVGLAIGVFFGYDRAQAVWTGGFTKENLWMGEVAITFLLSLAYIVKRTFMKQKKLPSPTQTDDQKNKNHHEHR